jgi:2-dehydropantoate 2-reductase
MTSTPASYAIIGTGAVGGYYGALLKRAGFPVHFLLHSDYEHVREHGIAVESKERCLFTGAVNAYARAADMPPCDVVLVTLKTTQNHLLRDILPRVTRPDGVALTLQNGLGIEDEIARIVGPARVMGGLCFLCSNKTGPGWIHHLDYGDVLLADYRGGIAPRLEAIAAGFAAAGITVSVSPDLLLARWKKLVWNIPFNGLSVVLDRTTDQIMATADHVARVRRIMNEVVGLAAACGRAIEPQFVQKMLDDTARMKPYRTSMKIDFDLGRPMEIESIYGNPLRIGTAAGGKAPEIEKLYNELKSLSGRS